MLFTGVSQIAIERVNMDTLNVCIIIKGQSLNQHVVAFMSEYWSNEHIDAHSERNIRKGIVVAVDAKQYRGSIPHNSTTEIGELRKQG